MRFRKNRFNKKWKLWTHIDNNLKRKEKSIRKDEIIKEVEAKKGQIEIKKLSRCDATRRDAGENRLLEGNISWPVNISRLEYIVTVRAADCSCRNEGKGREKDDPILMEEINFGLNRGLDYFKALQRKAREKERDDVFQSRASESLCSGLAWPGVLYLHRCRINIASPRNSLERSCPMDVLIDSPPYTAFYERSSTIEPTVCYSTTNE